MEHIWCTWFPIHCRAWVFSLGIFWWWARKGWHEACGLTCFAVSCWNQQSPKITSKWTYSPWFITDHSTHSFSAPGSWKKHPAAKKLNFGRFFGHFGLWHVGTLGIAISSTLWLSSLRYASCKNGRFRCHVSVLDVSVGFGGDLSAQVWLESKDQLTMSAFFLGGASWLLVSGRGGGRKQNGSLYLFAHTKKETTFSCPFLSCT